MREEDEGGKEDARFTLCFSPPRALWMKVDQLGSPRQVFSEDHCRTLVSTYSATLRRSSAVTSTAITNFVADRHFFCFLCRQYTILIRLSWSML